jgi:hypothetical protein
MLEEGSDDRRLTIISQFLLIDGFILSLSFIRGKQDAGRGK